MSLHKMHQHFIWWTCDAPTCWCCRTSNILCDFAPTFHLVGTWCTNLLVLSDFKHLTWFCVILKGLADGARLWRGSDDPWPAWSLPHATCTMWSSPPAAHNYTRRFNVWYRNIPIYTDGACFNNGKLNAHCRSGIWFATDDPCNNASRVPGPNQSNQISKIAAVINAISSTPPFYPLTILSDSKYVIEGLTNHLKHWEDIGWIGISNAPLFKRAAYLLKSRTGTTHFKWIKGHNGNQGNEECNRLAKEGVNKPIPNILDLNVLISFDLQGAKLSTVTRDVTNSMWPKEVTHSYFFFDSIRYNSMWLLSTWLIDMTHEHLTQCDLIQFLLQLYKL